MRYKEAKGSTNVRTTFQDCDILTGQSSYSMVAIKLKGGSEEEMPVIISSWWWCVLLLLISNSWPSSTGKTQQLPFPLLWHLFELVWPIKQPHLTLSTLQPEETHSTGGTNTGASWTGRRRHPPHGERWKGLRSRMFTMQKQFQLGVAGDVCSESQSSISHSPVNERWDIVRDLKSDTTDLLEGCLVFLRFISVDLVFWFAFLHLWNSFADL